MKLLAFFAVIALAACGAEGASIPTGSVAHAAHKTRPNIYFTNYVYVTDSSGYMYVYAAGANGSPIDSVALANQPGYVATDSGDPARVYLSDGGNSVPIYSSESAGLNVVGHLKMITNAAAIAADNDTTNTIAVIGGSSGSQYVALYTGGTGDINPHKTISQPSIGSASYGLIGVGIAYDDDVFVTAKSGSSYAVFSYGHRATSWRTIDSGLTSAKAIFVDTTGPNLYVGEQGNLCEYTASSNYNTKTCASGFTLLNAIHSSFDASTYQAFGAANSLTPGYAKVFPNQFGGSGPPPYIITSSLSSAQDVDGGE
jgi:hypothetical protein